MCLKGYGDIISKKNLHRSLINLNLAKFASALVHRKECVKTHFLNAVKLEDICTLPTQVFWGIFCTNFAL